MSELKAQTAVRIMSEIGYDAVALGEMELTYGKETLDRMFKDSKIDLTSANVIDLESKSYYTKPYIILERQGMRIGVFSVVYNATNYLSYAFKKIEDFRLEEPEAIIDRLIDDLEGKTDIIIMLSHMGERKAEEIAKKFPRIDIIISGHNTYKKMTDRMKTLKKVDETLLVFTNAKAQALGRLDLVFDSKNRLKAYAETNRLLDTQFHDDKAVASILAEYNTKSKALRAELFPKRSDPSRKVRTYVGPEECRDCHTEIYDSWRQTPHADALETLVEKGMEENQECLICHMTGFRIRRTFEESQMDSPLPGISCEACHGKGSRHIEDKAKTRIYGRTYKYICQRCHTPERDPDFDFGNDAKKVHSVNSE